MSEAIDGQAANTDRELWREREGDYYADSIHVTERGGIGINCGGTVIVMPLREWHNAADRSGWHLTTETAPKDGTAFLGIVEGRVRVIRWGKTSHVPLYGFCLADQGVEDFDICEPTHWMPLPLPPRAPEPYEASGLSDHQSGVR